MMIAIRKILELIAFLWANAITPLWVNAITPLWVNAIAPLWVKVKSMKVVDRPGDTIEISRLRLELRQATLKCVAYLSLYIIIALILYIIPITDNLSNDTSGLIGIVGFILLLVTFCLTGYTEFMKVKWLHRVLQKRLKAPSSAFSPHTPATSPANRAMGFWGAFAGRLAPFRNGGTPPRRRR